jgi:serine protease AprX
MKRLLGIAVLLVTTSVPVFGAGSSPATQLLNVSPDLQGADPTSTVDVIVQFNQAETTLQLQTIVALLGGTLEASMSSLNDAELSIPALALPILAALPEVSYVSPNRQLESLLDLSTAAVNAQAAWQSGWDGAGIGIAVVDSGISDHPDLNGRVVYSEDFVGTGTNDLYGHGEHVAGIAAGNGASSTCSICTRTFRGVAPKANLINLRVLDQNGSGTDSAVLQAMDRAIALRLLYNIRVINLSLGRAVFESYANDPLCQAVEKVWKNGVVVVVAAGNDGRNNSAGTSGYATIGSPGNDPLVITVGAMKTMGTPERSDDLIASYSSKGPTVVDHVVKPDLVAPGNGVVSLEVPSGTLEANYPQNFVPLSYYEQTSSTLNSAQYFRLSGTSMATPVVSGAVADLLEAQPTLTPDQVKARLMKTAYKVFPPYSTTTDPTTGIVYTSQYDIFTIGAGYLDVQAALANTDLAQGTALSPTVTYDASTGNVYLVTDPSSVWASQSLGGTQSVWGPQTVWGTSVFVNGTPALWGNQAVWGNSTTPGFNAVWSNQSVWGTPSSSGSQTVWGNQSTAAILN